MIPRLVCALLVIVASLIVVLNLAVIWHGWLFIGLMPLWGMAATRLFDWGRGVTR